MTDSSNSHYLRSGRLLLASLIVMIPELARADTLCPSWSGFNSVGDTWDYGLSLFLFTGWERWELIGLDTETGEVTIRVTGERATTAFVEAYVRDDLWRCDEDGLWNEGWTSTWTITGNGGEFSVSGDSTNDWDYPLLFLPQDPMEGDSWDTRLLLDTTTSDGDEENNRGDGDMVMTVDALTDDVVLGDVVPVLPIRRDDNGTLSPDFQNSYTSYYAEDIGLVRRDDLVLIDYTPAR